MEGVSAAKHVLAMHWEPNATLCRQIKQLMELAGPLKKNRFTPCRQGARLH